MSSGKLRHQIKPPPSKRARLRREEIPLFKDRHRRGESIAALAAGRGVSYAVMWRAIHAVEGAD